MANDPTNQSDPAQRQFRIPPRDSSSNSGTPTRSSNDAAAEIVRQQIDKIYDGAPDPLRTQPTTAAEEAVTSQQSHAEHTYDRTHSSEAVTLANSNNADAWKHYHSSWQNYYQQYYQRYYLQQLHAQSKKVSAQTNAPHERTAEPIQIQDEPELAAVQTDIRRELLSTIGTRAKKIQRSNHFLPIVSAIIVAVLFMTVQYNRVMVASVKAYVSPGAINPQNVILDPTTDTKVGPDPRIVVPKINVDAPLVYDVGSLLDPPVQKALERGVVHYPLPGADSLPGEKGNAVFLGHSSNDVFDNGNYKFVFVLLERLQPGDTFYIHHQGTRYTYSVTGKEVIDPTEVNKLVLNTDKPMATLVTCVPPGTALKRLVVYADQISPDPTKAGSPSGADSIDNGSADSGIPGNSPTLFERLFQ